MLFAKPFKMELKLMGNQEVLDNTHKHAENSSGILNHMPMFKACKSYFPKKFTYMCDAKLQFSFVLPSYFIRLRARPIFVSFAFLLLLLHSSLLALPPFHQSISFSISLIFSLFPLFRFSSNSYYGNFIAVFLPFLMHIICLFHYQFYLPSNIVISHSRQLTQSVLISKALHIDQNTRPYPKKEIFYLNKRKFYPFATRQ